MAGLSGQPRRNKVAFRNPALHTPCAVALDKGTDWEDLYAAVEPGNEEACPNCDFSQLCLSTLSIDIVAERHYVDIACAR